MLPDKAISEFQKLYQQEVGENIDFNTAKLKSENFIRLFSLITKNDNENKNKRLSPISPQ